MKLSDLILALQAIYNLEGDLDVVKYEEPTDSIQPISEPKVEDFYKNGWKTVIL